MGLTVEHQIPGNSLSVSGFQRLSKPYKLFQIRLKTERLDLWVGDIRPEFRPSLSLSLHPSPCCLGVLLDLSVFFGLSHSLISACLSSWIGSGRVESSALSEKKLEIKGPFVSQKIILQKLIFEK